MGDFFQQGPVGQSLVQASMHQDNAAGMLFNEFKRIEFLKQERAADDLEHVARMEFFRNPSASLTPVLASKIQAHLSVLTANDLKSDPAFSVAPVVCSDNLTRHAINKLRVFEFAKIHRQPVIAFRLPLSIHATSAFTAASVRFQKPIEELLDEHDELTFYFVVGAPIMCKDNISPKFGIANGSLGSLHSLTLRSGDDVDLDEIWARIAATPPGEVIFLDEVPLSVNIVLNSTPINVEPSTSLLPDKQVIPMLLSRRNARKIKVASRRNVRQLTYFDFGIDLAFALTYFKVQGLTLNRVILDLDTTILPKINVAATYVGLSRVRKADHIRVLPISNNCRLALNRLEFKKYLVEWLKSSSSS